MKNRQEEKMASNGMRYLLYLPADYTDKKRFPVLLFLHGSGERGNDLSLVKKHGPPRLIEQGKQFPFIILSPQCPRGMSWSAKALNALLNDVIYTYNGDEERIYITGISMGGYGTWDLVLSFPDEFAAAIPICGGGNPNKAELIANIPIWTFHGAKDDIVPLSESVRMMEALENVKGKGKLTVYPDLDHDCWTKTYDNPEIYDWLLQQKRRKLRIY